MTAVKFKKEKVYGSVTHLFFFIYQKINMGYITLLISLIRFPLAILCLS